MPERLMGFSGRDTLVPMEKTTHATFALPILQECKNGECGQCGRCCIAYEVIVPSVKGDAFSKPIRKRMGEICPQLIEMENGGYGCAVHEAKGAVPILDICKNWDGRDGGYHSMLSNMRDCVFIPDTPAQRKNMLNMLTEGRLADIDLTIGGTGDLVCALDNYLDGNTDIPHALYDAMGMRAFLNAYLTLKTDECMDLLKRLNISPESTTPSRRAFYNEYVAGIATRIGLPAA